MKDYFNNKIVWITGASSGIGKALAEACARRGAKIIISARREKLLDEIKTGLDDEEGAVEILPFDVTAEDEIPRKVAEAIKLYGRIDILVNNAGISMRSLVKDLQFEVVKKMIDTNFLAAVNLTLHVLPHMYKNGSGHIVVISSLMGKTGTPLRSAYCAAKHALQGFYETLAIEGRRDGIEVTMVLPGWVRTEISYQALRGDGATYGELDDGLSRAKDPSSIVPRILRAISKKKFELYVAMAPIMWIGLVLKRIWPAAVRRMLGKIKVT